MTQKPGKILIPYTRSKTTGEPIHINDAKSGLNSNAYSCTNPDCQAAMVAVKGKVRQHHFRHDRGTGFESCNESNLHYSAKHILARIINSGNGIQCRYPCGCNNRQAKFRSYFDSMPIPGTNHETTLGPYASATIECPAEWPGMNRRPDITAFNANRPATYFEIEVTNPPEYNIQDERIDAPVIIVRINGQEELDALANGIIINGEHPCGPCQSDCAVPIPKALKEKWQREKDKPFRTEAWKDLERMRQVNQPDKPLIPWNIDSFKRDGQPRERRLKSATKRDLHRRASILLQRGFQQHLKKLGLFIYETGKATLYASLRSTDVMDIWDCPEPALFIFPKRNIPKDESTGKYATALMRYAEHILSQTEAECRVHFYDEWKMNRDTPLINWWSETGDDYWQSENDE